MTDLHYYSFMFGLYLVRNWFAKAPVFGKCIGIIYQLRVPQGRTKYERNTNEIQSNLKKYLIYGYA